MLGIPKPTKIKSRKIRQSAKGEECTLETPACNHNNETVVLCHAPSESNGMGTKSDDHWAANGCSGCHTYLDTNQCSKEEQMFYWYRGIFRTQKRQIEKGIWEL